MQSLPNTFTVLIGLLTAYSPCTAQWTPMDSILNMIQNAKHDTTKLEALVGLSELYGTSNPDTVMVICKDALNRVDVALNKPKVGNQVQNVLLRIKATATNNIAVAHYVYGELDSALFRFKEAERIYRLNKDPQWIAVSLNNQSLILGLMGKHGAQRVCLFQALAMYRSVRDSTNAGYVLNNIGNYYGERGRPDSCIAYLDSSLVIFEQVRHEPGIASSLLNLGQSYADQGHPAEALEYLLRCEKSFDPTSTDRTFGVCLNNIGSIYLHQGLLDEALSYFHHALDIALGHGDILAEATARTNVGDVLNDQDEYDMALAEYEKCLVIYTTSGDRSGEALTQGTIGDVWKNKGDRIKALEYLNRSLAISEEIDDPATIATATYKLGHFHEDQRAYAKSLELYNTCLALDKMLKDRQSESLTLYSIGRVHLKMGQASKAAEFGSEALTIAQDLGFPLNIMRATQVLHEALAKQGKWEQALGMLELHEQMKDSIRNTDNAKKTVSLQMRYQFESEQLADSLTHVAAMGELENEKRIAELDSEQARKRTWAFGLGSFLLLGSGGAVYQLDKRRRMERFDRDATQLQMQIVRTQMNPHFIFNALNSINGYVLDNHKDLASGFLTKFAKLMRMVLENSRHATVPLDQDLETLRLYMDLERSRMQDKFDFTIDVDPSIDQSSTMVPPLVLQPFVENAVWHGISKLDGKGNILLKVARSGDQLVMTVEDNGVGRKSVIDPQPADNNPSKGSLGTRITSERLALFGKQLKGVAGFHYTEVAQGTRVDVEMPIVTA